MFFWFVWLVLKLLIVFIKNIKFGCSYMNFFFFILLIKKNEEYLENVFKVVRVNINKFIM